MRKLSSQRSFRITPRTRRKPRKSFPEFTDSSHKNRDPPPVENPNAAVATRLVRPRVHYHCRGCAPGRAQTRVQVSPTELEVVAETAKPVGLQASLGRLVPAGDLRDHRHDRVHLRGAL